MSEPLPLTKRRAKASVTPESYKLAMRQVASPVTIIAARRGEQRNGLTATAVCSASADPPILVVCVNRIDRGILVLVGGRRREKDGRHGEPTEK